MAEKCGMGVMQGGRQKGKKTQTNASEKGRPLEKLNKLLWGGNNRTQAVKAEEGGRMGKKKNKRRNTTQRSR